VTDVRFDNEAALIRSLGGTILHVRGERELAGLVGDTVKHASEAGVTQHKDDLLVWNDGSYSQLYSKLDQLMDWVAVRSAPSVVAARRMK
jgi:hypothetical protein